jgi:hypothetical protein
MAVIILVHGIAQEQEAADKLEEAWLPSLAGGVREGGFPIVADRIWRDRSGTDGIEARMAFYGRLFLKAGRQGSAPDVLEPDAAAFADALALEWIERSANRSSSADERRTAEIELANLRRPPGRQSQGWKAGARSAIQSLARLRWFAAKGMALAERLPRSALGQVTRYFTDHATRSGAQQKVLDLCGPETRVIIGHSLGSVVAFEAAHRLDRVLPLLVTIGSPLGLNTIVYDRLIPQPPTFPPRVRRWVNIADRDDVVAAAPDLTPLFSDGVPADARFEGGFTVQNGAKPHDASFYLTKPETGRPIGETLSDSGAAPEEIMSSTPVAG